MTIVTDYSWLLEVIRKGVEINLKLHNHAQPVFFLVSPDDNLTLCPWRYENEQEKYTTLAIIKNVVRIQKCKAVAMVSEIWAVDRAEPLNVRATECPDRREYIGLLIDTPEAVSAWRAPIERTSPPGDDTGRFVRLGAWEDETKGGGIVSGPGRFFTSNPQSV